MARAKKASREDWHPADIKAALHKRGITLRAIADAYGLSDHTSLSAAMVRSYPINERRIADAIGIHPKEIWPSRYNDDGSPKPRGFRAIQCNTLDHVRKGSAVATGGKKAGAV
jgi:lambda repressor-like predicted transcriptional regulator